MGQGYIRNDVTNNIANGNVITASDLDGEFDAIVAAFVNATGHTHDGTSNEGGAITFIGPVQDYVGDGAALYPKTASAYTLGKAGSTWFNVLTDNLTLGGTQLTSTAAELNYTTGVTSALQTQLNGKQPLAAALTGTTASYTIAEETKLAGIEALADVTDVTNVTAAGALMDSELTAIASVKALNQGVATTDSPTFVNASTTTVTNSGSLTVPSDLINSIVVGGQYAITADVVIVSATQLASTDAAVGSVLTHNVYDGTNATQTLITHPNNTMYHRINDGGVWSAFEEVVTLSNLPVDNYQIKTTTYTAVVGDKLGLDVTAGAFTVTMPASPAAGEYVLFVIAKGDATVNNVTVAGGAETINGDATLTVDLAVSSFSLVYNGAEWRVV
jgi:hypothetical protein